MVWFRRLFGIGTANITHQPQDVTQTESVVNETSPEPPRAVDSSVVPASPDKLADVRILTSQPQGVMQTESVAKEISPEPPRGLVSSDIQTSPKKLADVRILVQNENWDEVVCAGESAITTIVDRIKQIDAKHSSSVTDQMLRTGKKGALAPKMDEEVAALMRRFEMESNKLHDGCVRVERAVAALARIGGDKAVNSMISLANNLKQENFKVRVKNALSAMREPSAQVYLLIESGRWDEVAKFGESAIGPLLDKLKRLSEDGFSGKHKGSRDVLDASFEAVAKIGGEQAVIGLAGLIGSVITPNDIRVRAVDALVRMKHASSVPQLIALLSPGYGSEVKTKRFPGPVVDAARKYAIDALRDIGDARAVPVLIDMARNSNLVFHVIPALSAVGDTYAIKALHDLRKNPDSSTRMLAAEALTKFGWNPETQEEKLHCYYVNEQWEQFAALGEAAFYILKNKYEAAHPRSHSGVMLCRALKSFRNRSALPLLQKCLACDFDEEARIGAAELLGELGNSAAVPALLEALADKKEKVGLAAAAALARIRDSSAISGLVHALKRPGTRKPAIHGLENIELIAIGSLIEALQDEDAEVRRSAADLIVRMQEKGVWEPGTDEEKAWICRLRLEWDKLEEMGLKAVPSLIKWLIDKEQPIRHFSIRLLGRIGDDRAIAGLLETLQNGDAISKGLAAVALGRIGKGEATIGLSEVLKHGEIDLRVLAAEALGRIGDHQAIPALLEALSAGPVNVRVASAEALGNTGTAASVACLAQALKSETWTVRAAAAEALGKIADTAALAALKDASGTEEVYPAFMKISIALRANGVDIAKQTKRIDDQWARLVAQLGAEDWSMRKAAAIALGRSHDSRAVGPLLKVASSDSHREQWAFHSDYNCGHTIYYFYPVEEAAIEALGMIGDSSVVPMLIEKLMMHKVGDMHVNKVAANALAMIGDVRALSALQHVGDIYPWGHGHKEDNVFGAEAVLAGRAAAHDALREITEKRWREKYS